MKLIPAIDLKDNKCVRLQKGNVNLVTIFNDNPVEQAKFFEKKGIKRIHIVDLDAAFGRNDVNKQTILDIRKNVKIQIELGGGIRNEKDINFWLKSGIDFLIIGSLAVKEKKLVIDSSKKHNDKIYIALDVLEKKIMIKGWLENSNLILNDIFDIYNSAPIKGFILTDISRDGMLDGLDINLINSILSKTKKNIIVGGGLSDYEDLYNLKNLENSNLEGVIAGKSFYSGNIEIQKSLNILKDA